MARDPRSREMPDGAAMQEQIQAATSGLGPAEMKDVLQRLLAVPDALNSLLERPPPPPSRRRPRRAVTVTYRVRADLDGTQPPLWRRLELASDLFLDQVHEVMQVAFGWTDSHLHQFASGPGRYGPGTEHYLCPFQVEEGDQGVPEEDVRLDEVLTEPGGKLFYEYDFGDGWQHTIRLEAVLPRPSSAPRAVCVTGRRDGPPEDCGGVGAYELICAATDPANPDHTDAVAEFARFYGGDIEPDSIRTTPLDINEVNDILGGLELVSGPAGSTPEPQHLPGPLDDLVHAIRTPAGKRELRRLLASAQLDQPVLVDAATAERMVRPYVWLLDRVGDDGIKLTGAGYLPPAHVEAAVAELGLGDEWIGKGNRESQTAPVLHLRESATAMGLLRKRNGMLLLTSRARAVRTDPPTLWRHLAQRMPPASRDQCETQAGLILLTVIAARAEGDPDITIARLLTAIGWVNGNGTGLDRHAASQACWDTKTALRRLGALTGDWRSEAPTTDGITFARAALQSWPSR